MSRSSPARRSGRSAATLPRRQDVRLPAGPIEPSGQVLRRWLVTALVGAALPWQWAHGQERPGPRRVAFLNLQDQHDRPVRLDASTQWLVFAADKPGSELAAQVLRTLSPADFERHRLVYVADISAMPALVTRMFALPRLREWPYPVGLVRDAALVADWPRRPGEVTLMRLDAGVVTRLDHLGGAPALMSALEPLLRRP